jgi:hypothetical protein
MLAEKLKFIKDQNYFGIDKAIANKYIKTLQNHIECVVESGRKLGVPGSQLSVHDNSKWFETEFRGYALHFEGGGVPDEFSKAWLYHIHNNPHHWQHYEFSKAWLHHIHNNPHHWQHWIFPDNYTPKNSSVENGVVEMPSYYALEMVADWMGASVVYSGTEDMSNWLVNNINHIKVHSNTAEYLGVILSELGYKEIVNTYAFANGHGC